MWTHTEAISPLGNLCWVIRVGHSPQKKRVGMTIIENSNLSCQHLWKSQELDTVHCLWMFISVSFTWVIWAICRSNQVIWLLTPSHSEDNHDGGITHLEPDIPECEVKWALGSITMNKASGGDEIPAELFQIVKDHAVKVLHSICQQIWKTQQWPQDWKRSVFILNPNKGNAKKC